MSLYGFVGKEEHENCLPMLIFRRELTLDNKITIEQLSEQINGINRDCYFKVYPHGTSGTYFVRLISQ